MKHVDGSWLPDLTQKGYDVFSDYHRFLLLHGPRRSAKTVCSISKLARHLWDNDGAMVGVIGKTLRNIKSSGVWQDLTVLPFGIPQWINAKIGFDYTVKPKFTADTKMTYFRVRNRHGGESECQVHSLEYDSDVEDKFKGTRFSMFYLPECDRILNRYVWVALNEQLRCPHIPYEQHQIIGDCNPPEEGVDHPLYAMFFQHLHSDGTKFDEKYSDLYREIAFTVNDNIWMTESERNAQEAQYKGDPTLYQRYWEGKWVKYTEGGHFEEFFFPNVHVRGDVQDPDKNKWEIIVPTKQTVTLLAGVDAGDVNHAWSLLCPRDIGEKTAYDVIDEIVLIHSKTSIEDFTEQIIERMDFWEAFVKEEYGTNKLRWVTHGDPSMFRFNAAANSDAAVIMRNVSNNRILPMGVSKPAGSVKARISLIKRLLFGNLLFFSANCRSSIEMIRNLKKPRSRRDEDPMRKLIGGGPQIGDEDPLKHVFDSLTYALVDEIKFELERRAEPETDSPRMVSVG